MEHKDATDLSSDLTKKAECIMDDMASWNDYIKMIKEELGIELGIRANK